ncbi:c-type cytochrome [Thalassotalea piscium]
MIRLFFFMRTSAGRDDVNICRVHFFLMFIGMLFSVFNTSVHAKKMPMVYQQCVVCHGEKAEGNKNLKAPVLAGQSEAYLNRQLLNFANGLRGHHPKDTFGSQMVAISQQLDLNKEVPQLAAYLSALPIPVKQLDIEGNMKNGSRYYQARCGACHGGKAQGNPLMNAPRLSGQSIDYLKRQMINFATEVRGTHQSDKFGRQMAMMSKVSSGQELNDIFYYIAVQK